jgi:hypothetical protein
MMAARSMSMPVRRGASSRSVARSGSFGPTTVPFRYGELAAGACQIVRRCSSVIRNEARQSFK